MNHPIFETKLGVCGFYKFEAVRADGSARVLADWFQNLITDYGLNGMGSGTGGAAYCRIGSGSTAPANSDTALVAQVASVARQSAAAGVSSPSPYYGWWRGVYEFPVGAAAGNISEVGVSHLATGANLISRSLIRDSGGTPVTLTVLSDEILRVTYEFRVYVVETDATATITIKGVSTTVTARPGDIGTTPTVQNYLQSSQHFRFFSQNTYNYVLTGASSGIGAITGSPTGTFAPTLAVTHAAYTAGNFYRDSTLTVGGSEAVGQIGAIYARSGDPVYWQIGFSPRINKATGETLTVTARISWARYTP